MKDSRLGSRINYLSGSRIKEYGSRTDCLVRLKIEDSKLLQQLKQGGEKERGINGGCIWAVT